MIIDSTDNDNGNSFEYRLKEVSDEEIITILRYREHYQLHAVKTAIKEALKRGIISSIDELGKDDFKPQPLPPKSLFPVSSVESQNIAIFKSLCRTNYLFAIIPVVFAVFQAVNHSYIIAVISFLISLPIFFYTYKLEKERKTLFAQLLLLIYVPLIGFAIYNLSRNKPTTMDLVFTIVFIVVIIYTTFYLNKLSNYFTKNSGR
jgi:hypothetical protein